MTVLAGNLEWRGHCVEPFSYGDVHSARSPMQRRKESRSPPPQTILLRPRETPHFCWATPRVLKVMFACLWAQPLRGPLTALGRKPRSSRSSSDRTSRSSLTSSARIQTPTWPLPNPLPFGNATWQSSSDSSRVWGQMLHSIAAGSDASCPNAGAIACLLLQSIGSQSGPTGGEGLTKTTFIQRLNTKGGSAPGEGCSASSDVGKQTLVPYTADYYFFRKGK